MVIMKRISALLVGVFLLFITSAIADNSMIPDCYIPILRAWHASNGEDLRLNILQYCKKDPTNYLSEQSPKTCPLTIRFGGTTKDLIDDKSNWDLAIVSSRDVDLQQLENEGLIDSSGYSPNAKVALHQWLLPETLKNLLPTDNRLMFYIYFYDYDDQTNDATLLICQKNIGKKKNNPRVPNEFAKVIMSNREIDQVRTVEGLSHVNGWTQETLALDSDEWDAATFTLNAGDSLDILDQAGLLFDFSNDEYWITRAAEWFAPKSIPSTDGRLIAIPFVPFGGEESDPMQVFVVNAKSIYIQKAMDYAKHFIKSYEWIYDRLKYQDTPSEILNTLGISMNKDDMDW